MATFFSSRRLIFGAFVLALLVRLLYVLSIKDCYFFEHLQTEPKHYEEWVRLIQAGNDPPPPYEQAPGFPYFLSYIGTLAGSLPLSAAYAQAALGALTCTMLTAVSLRWFGKGAARSTALITAFYGPFIYYGGALLPETLFLFLSSSALLAAALATDFVPRSPREPAPKGERWWLCSGVLWGLAFYVRPIVLLAVPMLAYDAYQRGRARALARLLAPIALAWSVLVVANYACSGRFVSTVASGGENLWLGNNTLADGVSPFATGRLDEVAEEVRNRATDAVDANARLGALALTFMKEQPGAAVALAAKKLIWSLNDRELPNAGDPTWEQAQSWLFRIPAFPLSFGPLFMFGLAGAVLAGPRSPSSRLLGAFVVSGLLTCVVFFSNGRFRLCVAVPLSIWAGLACDKLFTVVRLRAASPPRALFAASAACLGALVAFGNFYGVKDYFVPEIAVNVGILEERAGSSASALAYLQKGVTANPNDVLGRLHLASILEQSGDNDEAMRVYATGLRLTPHDETLVSAVGQYLNRHPASH